ncbi:uncharacterized protein LOC124146684 [Haliotis rufescens]|uniref:uncharacterized protein LOC124146684 n=1 Tax=Haliotis rufescens TaxID=6454 RepID=UPI001EB013F0|nr:uncharacterized protein LOC124146684 [Haliotis rufescens]XP_046373057.1 uncharacterized protein LOC124146684 [Haliotis rufescens]
MSATKVSSPKRESTKSKSKTSSRPSSRGSNSKHLDDLNKETSQLREQVTTLQTENEQIKEKLRTLTLRLVEAGRQSGNEMDFDANCDILEIPMIELLAVIAELNRNGVKTRSHKSKDFDENRLEELETRVTLLNTELAKLFKLKLKVENGLQDLDRCRDDGELRKKAKYLWYESCGTQVFVAPKIEVEDTPSIQPVTAASDPSPAPTPTSRPVSAHSNLPLAVRINLERVHIATPPCKLPGDTHINNMHKGLLQLVIQDLSLYKGNGADWRLMAERVGVPTQLITQWKTMKLPQPMKNVVYVWGESPGATVRMLHRHLVSPQMKSLILAKRISDFYEVD